MRRSRLTSDLGQVVIDTMVGMDKDSSSVLGGLRFFCFCECISEYL